MKPKTSTKTEGLPRIWRKPWENPIRFDGQILLHLSYWFLRALRDFIFRISCKSNHWLSSNHKGEFWGLTPILNQKRDFLPIKLKIPFFLFFLIILFLLRTLPLCSSYTLAPSHVSNIHKHNVFIFIHNIFS